MANAVLGLASAQARAGAQVAIAALDPGGTPMYEAMDAAGIRLLTWRAPRRAIVGKMMFPALPREERERLRAYAPDVVHIHGELNPDNLPVPRVFRCPLVLSPHGGFSPNVFARGATHAKLAYVAVASQQLYRRATLHAISPLEADDIALLLPGAPCYCVHQGPGLHAGSRPAATAAAAERGQAGERTLRLLFVGRLNAHEKGLDLLLDGFAGAVARLPGRRLELVLAGPDWNGSLQRLRERCQLAGIAGQVRFTGPLPGSAIAALYEQCDCYIQLSRNEGFGLSVAEALVAGLPAILSRAIGAAAYPEISGAPHVRVVEPDSAAAARAICEVAETLPALREAALAQRERLRDFLSWERVALLHFAHYRRLIAHAPALALDGTLPPHPFHSAGPLAST